MNAFFLFKKVEKSRKTGIFERKTKQNNFKKSSQVTKIDTNEKLSTNVIENTGHITDDDLSVDSSSPSLSCSPVATTQLHSPLEKKVKNNDTNTSSCSIQNSKTSPVKTSLKRKISISSDDYEYSSQIKAKTESCTANSDLEQIECYLESDDLWKKFHELGTEMIITKSGRRMFPSLRVSFNNVKLNEKYLVAMDIVPTDNKRYRYAYHRSSWLVAGKADPPVQSRIFLHPDGPFTGDSLQKQIISFEKLKLTNNESDRAGHVSKS